MALRGLPVLTRCRMAPRHLNDCARPQADSLVVIQVHVIPALATISRHPRRLRLEIGRLRSVNEFFNANRSPEARTSRIMVQSRDDLGNVGKQFSIHQAYERLSAALLVRGSPRLYCNGSIIGLAGSAQSPIAR